MLTSSADEKTFAVGVFEDQHLNMDASGRGDRTIFLANVRRWTERDSSIVIIARSSHDVTPRDILEPCGKARLISIDGGHTEECALNDLMQAEAVLKDGGVAILDD